MPKSISQQLDEVFHEASASFLSRMLKSEADRAQFDAISRGDSEKQEDLTRRFHEEYNKRFDAARQRLLEKASHARLDHPPPPGGGDNRAKAIDSEAHREVQLAHEADLQRVRDETQNAFEDLLDRAYRRNQVKGMAVDAFRNARDRRAGEDRRVPRQSMD